MILTILVIQLGKASIKNVTFVPIRQAKPVPEEDTKITYKNG